MGADGKAFTTRAFRARREAGGRPQFLPADLFPQTRHARQCRCLFDRQGISAHRRDQLDPRTMDDGCWLRWPMATAASSPIICWAGGAWRQMTQFSDQVKLARLGRDDRFTPSRSVAPRGKMLRLSSDAELREAVDIVPASEAVMKRTEPAATSLYVSDFVGGPSRVRRFDLAGRSGYDFPSRRRPMCRNSSRRTTDRSFSATRVTRRRRPGMKRSRPDRSEKDRASPILRRSISATSRCPRVRAFERWDKVPVNILRRKGTKLDGSNPTLLYGYGGYGISLHPPLISRGGSGSTTVASWSWPTFAAAANSARSGTSPATSRGSRTSSMTSPPARATSHRAGLHRTEKLAVEGGSNGGLLMGAFLTQHPDLVRAVVVRTSASTTCCASNSTLTAPSTSRNSARSRTLPSSRRSMPTRPITMSPMAQSIRPSL